MLMQKKVLAATVVAAFAALPTLAMAQARGGNSDLGFYAGASVGQSKSDCNGGGSCDDKDTAYRIFGGYKINRNFAVEAGYTDFGKVNATVAVPAATLEVKSNAFEVVGVGALPLNQQFSVYGKLGFYRGEAKASATLGAFSGSQKETNTDLTLGVGVQYNFNPQLGVRGEWQRYGSMGGDSIGGTFDLDVFAVGVTYKF
jgi:OOP family OmpA-OmpF porin